MTTVMTRIQAAVVLLCILALAVAVLALVLAEFHAWWCLVILWSGACLIDLLRARHRR